MRIHVLSDLHFEFGEVPISRVECDAVVLAGDISTKCHGVRWALRNFPDVPIIYVAGNHEFYGENLPSLYDKLRAEAAGSQVHVLENESVEIRGCTFFGCTLWTDFALLGDPLESAAEAAGVMNDYKRIRNSDLGFRRLSTRDTRRRHVLEKHLATVDRQRSIVITHHAPSLLSLPESRRAQTISGAYASSMEDLIAQFAPRLWIHGHIHHSNDYQLGSTRVLANPRAYPDAPNPTFRPDLVVTLSSILINAVAGLQGNGSCAQCRALAWGRFSYALARLWREARRKAATLYFKTLQCLHCLSLRGTFGNNPFGFMRN